MLNKPAVSIARKTSSVKNMARAFALIASLGTVTVASSAQAYSGPLVEKTFQVEFKVSEVTTPEGTAEVYARLMKKANQACISDRQTLEYTGETVAQCTEDLLQQFIGNADVSSLTDYHRMKATTST